MGCIRPPMPCANGFMDRIGGQWWIDVFIVASIAILVLTVVSGIISECSDDWTSGVVFGKRHTPAKLEYNVALKIIQSFPERWEIGVCSEKGHTKWIKVSEDDWMEWEQGQIWGGDE